MGFYNTIESKLPDTDGWQWYNGARYRVKRMNDSTWYGCEVRKKGNEIKATPVIGHPVTTEDARKVVIFKSTCPAPLNFDEVIVWINGLKKETEKKKHVSM